MVHVVYEMEPIGVDGELEAVASHPYCSSACQMKHSISEPFKLGEENSSFDGLVCEACGKPIAAPMADGSKMKTRSGIEVKPIDEASGMEWPTAAPMAEERETAQWYVVNSQMEAIRMRQEDDRKDAEAIDLTPESLKTPEGQEKVARALRKFEDSHADVANRATQFLHDHGDYLVGLARSADDGEAYDIREEYDEVREAIRRRSEAQDNFLRALAGR